MPQYQKQSIDTDHSFRWILHLLSGIYGRRQPAFIDSINITFIHIHLPHVLPSFGFDRGEQAHARKRDLYDPVFHYTFPRFPHYVYDCHTTIRQAFALLAHA